MSPQWRVYNHDIRDNLKNDDEEEYTMNQLVYMSQINSSNDEHIQRGGSRPSRKPNKNRLALFYVELLHNDNFSETRL
jgi:hypothetical protein